MRPIRVILLVLLAAAALPALAVPDVFHYQGVLRDAGGNPLTGSFDVVFRFTDVEDGEILVASHTAANGHPVTAENGLFEVWLGEEGTTADGSGPGTYTFLPAVFRDYADVHLELEVHGEVLSPQIRIGSVGYAVESAYLGGLQGGQFLRSDAPDVATGQVTLRSAPTGPAVGQGPLYVNPPVAGTDETLLGVAVNGDERFRVNSWGGLYATTLDLDSSLRSSGLTSSVSSGDAGYFASFDGDFVSIAWVGSQEDYGVWGLGSQAGGYFHNGPETGRAFLGTGTNRGIEAYGDDMGGYFEDTDGTGYAYVAYLNRGIVAAGTDYGVHGVDTGGGTFGRVGYNTYTTYGPGTKNFVQNHPYEAGELIVYSALEGDEVGTYTRGRAKLVDGVARVRLGESFAWVTNPDIGLTAHVTPRGEDPVALAVAAVTPRELLVHGPAGSNAAFDYVVYGLRIGFEEVPVIQEKPEGDEAYIPSMAEHRELLARRPELRSHTALERFQDMREATGEGRVEDLGAADALKRAIVEFDPALHALPGPERRASIPRPSEVSPDESPSNRIGPGVQQVAPKNATTSEPDPEEPAPRRAMLPPDLTDVVQVGGPVEAGDVLAIDLDDAERAIPARRAADPTVLGIVVARGGGEPAANEADGAPALARIASTGIVACKVDAGYGAIRPGDLLVSSPTPGHAMRAVDSLPGTVIGKALAPLEFGTGRIRVAAMLR